MRVAIWHDLPTGGGLRAMSGQVRELLALGHEVAIWSPASASLGLANAWLPAAGAGRRIPFGPERGPDFLDRWLGSSLGILRSRMEVLDAHARMACDEMAKWGADVLLVHPCVWFFASPLALHWAGPSVLYLQEPCRRLYEAMPENIWAAPDPLPHQTLRERVGSYLRDHRQLTANRVQVREEIRWVRAYDRVLVNSLYSRESVLRAYGVEATYCPLGVDSPATFPVPGEPKTATVVSLGELGWHKGARFAVEALARIPAVDRPPLHWYGNREDERYARTVRAAAGQMGVDFQFFLMAPDEAVSAALGRAACFVFCPRLEPLGFAPLEANLAGTAVVAVAEGGIRETIVDGVNGTMVAGRDPDAFARAIQRYTSDLDAATRAGLAARDHVSRHHTWQRAGKSLETELLATVAAGGR